MPRDRDDEPLNGPGLLVLVVVLVLVFVMIYLDHGGFR